MALCWKGGTPCKDMNISLPDPLKQFVDGQIAQGRYSSASEYMRELIRADEKRKAEDKLEAKLLEGLKSLESELTPADWSVLRKDALARSNPESCRSLAAILHCVFHGKLDSN